MIENLIGKIFTKIEHTDEEIIFYSSDSEIWKMYHEQDCCESVLVEDICGDLNDLIESPIIQAFEKTNDRDNLPDCAKDRDMRWIDSCTWTFYTLSTRKGTVTIRWYGESNGYYSESVSIEKIN